ncbi:Leucine-rich repeat domain superfamily [Sesbania bispinosa]|nr:Leucine-rich repeat domain superfamily [Sesbania bispinosa]
MDPHPGNFPILSYVMSRLPSFGPRTPTATSTSHSQIDLEQPPPADPSSSSSSIVDKMPHLKDPKLLAAMTRAISDVSQARSVLKLIGEQPTHEEVDNAKAKLADLEAHLSRQLEEIVVLQRPPEIDEQQWRVHLTEREKQCRESAEKEKRVWKSLIQLDEMHDSYEKLLKDAEKRLVKIYEGEGDNNNDDDDSDVGGEEKVNEHVAGMLQEASGKGVERVDLSGQHLRKLPEAFGRVTSLVVLNLSTNQLSVTKLATFHAFPYLILMAQCLLFSVTR